MAKKLVLDEYEQEIEDNIESITLRVHERDLEAMRLKASRLGVPYQTYINMLIHRDASSGLDVSNIL